MWMDIKEGSNFCQDYIGGPIVLCFTPEANSIKNKATIYLYICSNYSN